ncbi:MAG: hypothetical protein ACPHAS_10335 [Synechococcus sp.]
MTELEIIRLRAKLHRLELPDDAIKRVLEDCETNLDTYETASKRIDAWTPRDPGSLVVQALACGLIAAVLGGTLARIGGV